jgi:hypothetical protein
MIFMIDITTRTNAVNRINVIGDTLIEISSSAVNQQSQRQMGGLTGMK